MAQFYENTPAVSSELAPLRVLNEGTASIASGSAITAAIPDARVKADSVIVCWGVGAANATALTFSVDDIIANTSFKIGTNANATVAAKSVRWAVLKY